MPKYHIWTIGCQMNVAESERLASSLETRGLEMVANPADADLVIINSCVVRQSAENRVLARLESLKAPRAANSLLKIALTGCLVEPDIPALARRFPQVDYFFGPGETPPWETPGAGGGFLPAAAPVSVNVPIMQGCDNFCTYCIVPYRRGRQRSRPAAEVVAEVAELVRRGAREVVLLGQNVDTYGHDLEGGTDLAGLLGEVSAVAGLARIRFLTSHPQDMSPRLIGAIASHEKVCGQVSLPVQSGCDDILAAMRRGYNVAHYRDLIGELRRRVPGVALSTDVIVGFPGETRSQFEDTVRLLRDLAFDTVHVAAYSPRTGTLAARELSDDVTGTEKKARLAEVERLSAATSGRLNQPLQGQEVEVLVEGRKGGKWQGRTRSGKLVFFADPGDWRGRLAMVTIARTSPWALQGNIKE